MTHDRPPLVIEDMTITYGSFCAVDAVSFDARRGEILGLLGPNGAGKTSVIRALTTIVPVTSGSAFVGGHPLSDRTNVRRSIGVLPESNGYPGAQTARSYLRFHGQLFGMSRAAADGRADQLLDLLGLGSIDRPIATFSRGMRQRLGLSRALMNQPTVLFLDEPTLGLDPAGKEEMLAHLTRAAVEEGTCVVLCSHLLDEVERVCDRVAVMHLGRIVATGTVDEVVAASGVPSTARIGVHPDEIVRVDELLRDQVAVAAPRYDSARPGDIEVRLPDHADARSDLLRALLDAGVAPRMFDVRGARLSGAFLALTQPEGAAA